MAADRFTEPGKCGRRLKLLEDRIALITGGGGGIGRSIASAFANEGAAVALIDTDLNAAQLVAQNLINQGHRAIAIKGDVSELISVQSFVAAVCKEFGGIDILVSNAGILVRKGLFETTEEELDRILAVNAKGFFLCAQQVAPLMKERGGGHIIAIASVLAHIGFGFPAYTASKGAIVSLVRELAGELAVYNINVNGISPATIEGTGITSESLKDPAIRNSTISVIPKQQLGQPDQVAASALFLASRQAEFITGHMLMLDGGLSASVFAMQKGQ